MIVKSLDSSVCITEIMSNLQQSGDDWNMQLKHTVLQCSEATMAEPTCCTRGKLSNRPLDGWSRGLWYVGSLSIQSRRLRRAGADTMHWVCRKLGNPHPHWRELPPSPFECIPLHKNSSVAIILSLIGASSLSLRSSFSIVDSMSLFSFSFFWMLSMLPGQCRPRVAETNLFQIGLQNWTAYVVLRCTIKVGVTITV